METDATATIPKEAEDEDEEQEKYTDEESPESLQATGDKKARTQTFMNPLEVESGHDDDDRVERESRDGESATKSPPRLEPRWVVLVRYLVVSLLASVLVVTCPKTKLWRSKDETGDENLLVDKELLTSCLLLYAVVLISLLLLNESDPGYITQASLKEFDPDSSTCTPCPATNDPESDEMTLMDGKHSSSEITHRARVDPLARQAPDGAFLEEDALYGEDAAFFQSTRRKYCETCQFSPPLRSHHCKICKKCVATFDHHCAFIGTCIGERNHCRFWWFLLVQTLAFFMAADIVGSSSLGFFAFFRAASWSSLQVILTKFYIYPLTLASLMMLLTHTWMAFANMTTFECSKGPESIDYLRGTQPFDLPFSKGLDTNLRIFCCERDALCALWAGKRKWIPRMWKLPGKIVRDSEDWWENPWQNKYWSCC